MRRTDIVKNLAVPGSSFRPLGPEALLLLWDDVWYRNLLLASVLVGLIFLMALSIYLASTRPTVPSTPETRTGSSGGAVFVQSTVMPSSVPVPAWGGRSTVNG